jgi:hypothetical protein
MSEYFLFAINPQLFDITTRYFSGVAMYVHSEDQRKSWKIQIEIALKFLQQYVVVVVIRHQYYTVRPVLFAEGRG